VLLLWAYLMACIFLLSAEICAQLNVWFMAQNEKPRIRIFVENNFADLPAEIPPPM